MSNRDKRIDDYIMNAKDFAKPILLHIRELIHITCPEVTETMKWNFPHFEYKGMLCSMASFKNHCVFGFAKHEILEDPHGLIEKGNRTAMGIFGRLKSVDELPDSNLFAECIKQAMMLNENNIKLPKKKMSGMKKDLVLPADFILALEENNEAKSNFDSLSYSHKKEYVEYIDEAKKEETKKNRIEKSIIKLSDGKSHNWKYASKQQSFD